MNYRLLSLLLTLTLLACRETDVTPTSMPAPPGGVIDYLALGDSYTIGGSVPASERWPVQLAEWLRFDGYEVAPPEIIARTGWPSRTSWLPTGCTPPAHSMPSGWSRSGVG